jgi:hypothetical protein
MVDFLCDISKDGSRFLIFGCAKKKNEVNYRYAEKNAKSFAWGGTYKERKNRHGRRDKF